MLHLNQTDVELVAAAMHDAGNHAFGAVPWRLLDPHLRQSGREAAQGAVGALLRAVDAEMGTRGLAGTRGALEAFGTVSDAFREKLADQTCCHEHKESVTASADALLDQVLIRLQAHAEAS